MRKKIEELLVLPLVALRGIVLFPNMSLYFDAGKKETITAIEESMGHEQLIFVTSQINILIEELDTDNICQIGVVSKIKQVIKLPDGNLRVLVEGLSRGKIQQIIKNDGFHEVNIEYIYEKTSDELTAEALQRIVQRTFEKYVKLNSKVSSQLTLSMLTIDKLGELVDFIAANIYLKRQDRQKLIECVDIKERAELLCNILENEIEILDIEKNIQKTVTKNIDLLQREYYLKEQLKVIKNELGYKEQENEIVERYREKIEASHMPKEAYERVNSELAKLSRMSFSSPESAVISNYIELMCNIPWDESTFDNLSLKNAKRILDSEHFGLEKVKERIIEFIAVKKIKKNMQGPILCLVGPPGVGKTSIAKSIAKSMEREFVRMSLGGVKDEAEIRGHRKTYVGAMPGKIISLINKVNSNNPVFLLDEIDKMCSDYRDGAISAMLEVLDYEQNNKFLDNYLEVSFDLSKVLFIATANSLESIPQPLRDRMEIVYLSGYLAEEKADIAIKYLIPKQLEDHGVKRNKVTFKKDAVYSIIEHYTREAGVRELQRQIAKICRKLAVKLAESEEDMIIISKKDIKKYLGIRKFESAKVSEKNEIGLVKGLAWTQVGGEILDLEVLILDGNGKIELTGNLGYVMKESAYAAISFIRSIAKELDIDEEFYKTYDIHVHFPEGAIPKDGPSAGITIATAIVSGLKNTPVRKDVAMTGEITLRGNVLPIGGIKEKSLAALRAGIKNVICPIDNKKDVEEIPKAIREKINYIYVSNLKEVLSSALL